MKLNAPLYQLKRQARLLSRRERIPLHEALDTIARQEGFNSWSLLASRASTSLPGRSLLAEMEPGDLILLGARPGHGKTLLSLELAIEAMRSGHRAFFFSLAYSEAEMVECFAALGETPGHFEDAFVFDNSDGINADYIAATLSSIPEGSIVVIDYLQLLDQRRDHPPLMDQVRKLEAFAREQALILVFISQIHRRFDETGDSCPGLAEVHLPNPLDLTLFDKALFLNRGVVNITVPA